MQGFLNSKNPNMQKLTRLAQPYVSQAGQMLNGKPGGASGGPGGAPGGPGGDWVTYHDDYGRPYYHNSRTGETSWTMPAAAPPPPPPYGGGPGGGSGYGGGSAYGGGGAYPSDPAYPSEPTYGVDDMEKKHKPHHQSHHGHGASSGAGGAYIAQTAERLVLREKVMSLSGDDFSIFDASGQKRFQVNGLIASLHERKKLKDMQGRNIYELTENKLTIRTRQKVIDSQGGGVIATMRKKSFIPSPFGSTFLVWRGDGDNGTPWLECKGNFLRKSFRIDDVAAGRPVAKVGRKMFNFKNLMFDKDSYQLEVYPGADVALMCLVVIGIDEAYHDEE